MAVVDDKILQAVNPDIVQLNLPAKSKYLSIIGKVVKAISQLLGFNTQQIGDIRAAVGESCLNVVQHAYSKKRKYSMKEEIVIRFLIYPTKLEVVVRDMGCGYDPVFSNRYIHSTDVGKADRLKMGLHIMQRTVDELDIDSQVGRGTQIRMTKYLSTAEVYSET